jgi:cleavage and polyadenylation specificity factor subunit 1
MAAPDLVTANGSTLSIYRVEENTGKMLLVHSYPNLAGNVCFLETLSVDDYQDDPYDISTNSKHRGRKIKCPDSLLIGFSGNPRLALVQVKPHLLLATTLLDLTPALTENCYGAVTPLEQDLTASLLQRKGRHQATAAVVLGGGVAVVSVQLKYFPKVAGWSAVEEPYLLPLMSLAQSIEDSGASGASGGLQVGNLHNRDALNPQNQSIITGFGDILDTAFLPGYLEPTMVTLHANPHVGHTWSGRLGREEGGTRYSLILTAVTVTVGHQRSALLWSTEVPADAMHVYSMVEEQNADGRHSGTSSTGAACVVHCVNSVVFISNTGQIQQCLATNGWVGSTLSATYSYLVEANPWPFPKLSIQLDGAQFTAINNRTWLVVLRRGEVYLLQYSGSAGLGRGKWSFMSLYQKVGALGEVSQIRCQTLGEVSVDSNKQIFNFDKESWMGSKYNTGKAPRDITMEIGLVFVSSRLGDSSLLGFVLEETSVANALITKAGNDGVKKESTVIKGIEKNKSATQDPFTDFIASIDVDEAYDRILKLEEEALYAPVSKEDGTLSTHGPNVVPPSDDESDEAGLELFGVHAKRKRARLSRITVVRRINVLDSLTATGPLGPACSGPLATCPEVEIDPTAAAANTAPVIGTPGYIFPCGFGSSGGLALLSIPGRDDRTVLAEADCVNAKALFSLSNHGIVFLAVPPMQGGTTVMKLSYSSDKSQQNNAEAEFNLHEVDLSEWCKDEDSRDFFGNCNLLAATDLTKNSFLIVVASPVSEESHIYFTVVFRMGKTISMSAAQQIDLPYGTFITSVTTRHDRKSNRVLIACTLTTGGSKLLIINGEGAIELEYAFDNEVSMDTEDDQDEEETFYASNRVVAMDIFKAPGTFFATESGMFNAEDKGRVEKKSEPSIDFCMDEDDKELYGEAEIAVENEKQTHNTTDDNETKGTDKEDVWYTAICRQSGVLEIYDVSDPSEALWKSSGCGHGVPQLATRALSDSSYRTPKSHKIATREMRFFFCGPSSRDWDKSFTGPRPFCLLLETSEGDTMVYTASVHQKLMRIKCFERIPMKDISRQSQESKKHFSKLRRKRIVSAADGSISPNDFRYNHLFPFQNVQKQNGAFAAASRPFWLIAERGRPTVLYHRSRHVAPAGARDRPVGGFCAGLHLPFARDFGFMTLHERVGRVGSQRMTLFDGLVNLNAKYSLIPGGGFFIEKIPFGVTVRKIQFIDDAHVSTGTHPLYAVLVSRDYEADHSDLNDDGLTEEERQQMKEEKENAKIQRQVEADLGGFDVEQEWVEEIEREDCFKIDKDLGGAPPFPRSAYAVWIVDAANGWQVVDSYELDEDEIGMTMQIMSLTDFLAEPGSNEEVLAEDLDSKLFITVGTGIVNKDGEDVASKGRCLLFEVKRSKDITELNFLYDKKIHHGPVTSLSCLNSEGKKRLIIGAGADVNVEQWGNDKLTQVGFFRATMQVLDIKLFKNFFILSDAYDSLYFLVWRESDKSLTLLAKDYDPNPVYAAGTLSRGGSLDFVCHDDRQNVQFFQYSPGDPAARGGNKLVCRADFHIGTQTTDIASHFCRSSLLINSATPSSTLAALKQQDTFHGKAEDDQRLAVSFGTTDGGYSAVVPLSEPVYWRLTALQSVIVNALESDCGLSHRAWRLYRRTPRRGGCQNNERKKGVVDGDLVMKYADLPKADQEDLASAIGSTVDMILDNLLELRCSSMVL